MEFKSIVSKRTAKLKFKELTGAYWDTKHQPFLAASQSFTTGWVKLQTMDYFSQGTSPFTYSSFLFHVYGRGEMVL